jgi:hypothetical protein
MPVVNPIQVQKHLSGVNYPASKQEIIDCAEREGADNQVLDALRRMPGDRFNGPDDVAEAIGKLR